MYTNNIKFDQTVKMSAKKKRNIQKIPYRILEAPRLKDDFYLNLIDWSQSNQIAVGLQSEVYLWSGCSSKV
jgi:cell division cycle 20-like protein 1 (cofactor of APC complex)